MPCLWGTSPAIPLNSSSSVASPSLPRPAILSTAVRDPAWIGSVKKPDLPPGCNIRGMETSNLAEDPDALGIEAAAGTEAVEVRPMPDKSGGNPGGGIISLLKRDTPFDVAAGVGALGTPPKTGMGADGVRPILDPPVARAPVGAQASAVPIKETEGVAGIHGTEPPPSKSRKVVRSSLGSGGRGGMFVMQTPGIVSRACYITVAKLKNDRYVCRMGMMYSSATIRWMIMQN